MHAFWAASISELKRLNSIIIQTSRGLFASWVLESTFELHDRWSGTRDAALSLKLPALP
jgi:hypothetical protein